MKKMDIRKSLLDIFTNLSSVLGYVWAEKKLLVVGYYMTSALAAFFPIIVSYTYKLLVDYLIINQGITATIPMVLVSVLGMQYLVNVVNDYISYGLKNVYFDYLLRYVMQNLLTLKFYGKVSNLDIAHFESPQTQDLITKAKESYLWRLPDYLRQFSQVFTNLVTYISVVLLLSRFGLVAPFVLTLVVLPRLLLRTKFGHMQWSIYDSRAPEVRKLWVLGWFLSNKEAVTESRIFQSQNSLLKKVKEIQDYLYQMQKKTLDNYLKFLSLPHILEVIVIFVFAYLKLPQVLNGQISIGDYTFFIGLLSRLIDSASGVVLSFGEMYENNLYVGYFDQVLKLPKIIKEPEEPKHIGDSNMPPKIEFRNVSFKYPQSDQYVLKNINFIVNSASNLAIVGKNGAGKTTLIKLLCRFYDVTDGEILINGINIKEISLNEWYQFIGTLFQEFIHYDFTVKENITLGNEKQNSEEKIIEAAKKSGAHEFIEKLPNKYNQLLGRQFEGGIELSQGQWQKLAIARAFYEGAPVLILDEPTSAIDAESEYDIFNNLHKFYKNKSLVFVSHRFSTVRNADKIIVLENGQIVEEGNHDALLKQKGIYKKMFEKQAIGYK